MCLEKCINISRNKIKEIGEATTKKYPNLKKTSVEYFDHFKVESKEIVADYTTLEKECLDHFKEALPKYLDEYYFKTGSDIQFVWIILPDDKAEFLGVTGATVPQNTAKEVLEIMYQ